MTLISRRANRCFECGEYVTAVFKDNTITEYGTNKEAVKLVKTDCLNMTEYKFNVEFPTGEIICNDSIEPILEKYNHYYGDINTTKGKIETTRDFAKRNVIHVFVGNTCPSIYKENDILAIENIWTNQGRYCICGNDRGKFMDESKCDCGYIEAKSLRNSEEIASICTDLWWTTIIDKKIFIETLYKDFDEDYNPKWCTEDEIKEKRKEIKDYIAKYTPIETKIKPGVYECCYRIRASEKEENSCEPTTYLTLKWISDIDNKKKNKII